MLNSDENYQTEVMNDIFHVYSQDLLPKSHSKFLKFLERELHCTPRVIFDIGSAVLHWDRHAKRIWPYSSIVCFDVFPLWKNYTKNVMLNIKWPAYQTRME